MTWFETLTGFAEESALQVRANITVDGNALKSHVNGNRFVYGQLEIPSLAQLRERVQEFRNSICLKWCLLMSLLIMESESMKTIVLRDRPALSQLVRERFIEITLRM